MATTCPVDLDTGRLRDEIPAIYARVATASFAGVANPLRIGTLTPGATVMDIGCGAGMDLMLAASAVGLDGHAIGIDMTEPMAERARASARALGFAHVDVRAGDALDVPVESETVDFVISNGVLNLDIDLWTG
jgi:ubiquinone/menaquinone biosynthesis C-methylase UbiE